MAKKQKTNGDKLKDLLKDLENTPYGIGSAILRERLLTLAEYDLKSIDENPEQWQNPMISVGMYKDYATRVINFLKFED